MSPASRLTPVDQAGLDQLIAGLLQAALPGPVVKRWDPRGITAAQVMALPEFRDLAAPEAPVVR